MSINPSPDGSPVYMADRMVAVGRAAERSDIVAWLRKLEREADSDGDGELAFWAMRFGERIERGEHAEPAK